MSNDFNPACYVLLGFRGHTPRSGFLNLIENYPPAGFLLLEENYKDPDQLYNLISRLKSYSGREPLFAVDQEPGRVQRFKNRFPISKYPGEYVTENDTANFIKWCGETVEILSHAGINLNFAPVLDLCSFSRDYPVLNGRSFGEQVDNVKRFAGLLIEEHRKKNILTCGKHFPGLGSARNDPHEKIALAYTGLDEYRGYHWAPFEFAIENGIEMIMTTHLKAAALDPIHTATYSPAVIGYLKEELDFGGMIISDDLLMGGAGDMGHAGENALNSLAAGHNLVIISRDIKTQEAALDCIKKRYEADESFGTIADENMKKIDRFKERIRSSG